MPEKRLSSTCEKSDKNNLRIISKPHAYLQTMTKTTVKFQKNQYKTVEGVAPTRYLTSIGGRKDEQKDRRKDGEAKTKSFRFSSWRGTKIESSITKNNKG